MSKVHTISELGKITSVKDEDMILVSQSDIKARTVIQNVKTKVISEYKDTCVQSKTSNFVSYNEDRSTKISFNQTTLMQHTGVDYDFFFMYPGNKVRFYPNGGEISQNYRYVAKGSSIGNFPSTTRLGYDHLGWFSDPNGGTQYNSTSKIETGLVNMYCHWNPIPYNIEYVMNGHGEQPIQALTTYTIEDTPYIPPTPIEDGYQFTGWIPNGGIEKDGIGDRSLTAQWQLITYSITYDMNGHGLLPPIAKKSYTIEDIQTSPYIPPIPDSDGDYEFTRWTPSQINEKQTGNVNFIATWTQADPSLKDYFDSVEEWDCHYGNTNRNFKPGRYEVIAVGAGGYGGRSNPGIWGIQGAFGGGSGAAISGMMILDDILSTNINVSIADGNTIVYEISNTQSKTTVIKAETGYSGTWGFYRSYGGQGGCLSQCLSAIMTSCVGWDGNDGKSKDSGNTADGGFFATNRLQYGGGSATGTGYSGNKGTSYTPTYGYLHIERYMEAKYYVDGEQYGPTQYIRRTNYSSKPTDPVKSGYIFKGWHPDPTTTMMSQDRSFHATFEVSV